VPVIEQILDVFPNFKQYVKCMDEKKVRNPGTKRFEVVKSAC